MANKYDRILKENLKPLFRFLTKEILGIEAVEFETLKDKLQVTLEREADFAMRAITTNPKDAYILHGEIQVKNEKDIDKRFLLYYGILHHLYKIPVKQFLIYIGESKNPKIKNTIEHENLSFKFHVVNLQDYDVEKFLTSDQPEEIILAILANFGTNKPEEVVKRILQKIENIIGRGLNLEKYARQLQILSMLRKLQPITNKIINDMALTLDIREDIVYQQGLSDATLQAKTEIVTNMLLSNSLTVEQIANFTNTTEKFVKEVKKSLQKK